MVDHLPTMYACAACLRQVQYLSIRYMVENRVAAGILAAVAALHRPAERFILQFVEVSRLLGQALNGHDACILVAIHVCFG